MKTLLLLSISISLMAQKPQATPVTGTVPVGIPGPPKLDTAKFWRSVAKAQNLRNTANQTPQAKSADEAEAEVRKEQGVLEAACGSGFVLRMDQDPKSPTFEDLKCEKVTPPPEVKK